jgi:hypothetical protein
MINLAGRADQLLAFESDLICYYESWLFGEPNEKDQESVGNFLSWVRAEIARQLVAKRGAKGISYQDAKMKKAPWTEEEVCKLNEFQKDGRFHPFTCGGDRRDENHLDGEGVLVATPNGWMCPYCDYKQDWCHQFMSQ